jgi:predicted dinucleotide-binding enzyme
MSSYSIIGSRAIGSALAGHSASKGIEVLLTRQNLEGSETNWPSVTKKGCRVRQLYFRVCP